MPSIEMRDCIIITSRATVIDADIDGAIVRNVTVVHWSGARWWRWWLLRKLLGPITIDGRLLPGAAIHLTEEVPPVPMDENWPDAVVVGVRAG